MDERIERLLPATAGAPTRRAVLRGLAGVLATAGLGSVIGEPATARRRNRRRRQCRRANQCEQPFNPCQEAICRRGRCRTRAVADGTDCGNGLVCEDATCVCPNGVCTVQVTSGSLSSWHGLDDCGCGEVNDSILTFRNGPASPPYGPGSVELTAASSSSASLGTFQFANALLNEITILKYSTFQPSSNDGPASKVGVLSFGIDFFGNNPLFGDRLVFDPNENSTPVAQDNWQEWDAIEGGAAKWLYEGAPDWPNTNPPISAADLLTWIEILTIYPNARINFNDPVLQITLQAEDDPFTEAINSVTFGNGSGTTRFVFG